MEAKDLVTIEPNPRVEEFSPGDTVRVGLRITEGDRQRTQVFEGVVIRRAGRGTGQMFNVLRMGRDSYVEKVFALHSPLVEKIDVVKSSGKKVKRSKLYHLRAKV